LKVFNRLLGQSFFLGAQQGLEKSLLVADDPSLVVDLFFVIGESLSPHTLLLLLYLSGNEVGHGELGSLLEKLLHFLDEVVNAVQFGS
jgi:hypothetical protein